MVVCRPEKTGLIQCPQVFRSAAFYDRPSDLILKTFRLKTSDPQTSALFYRASVFDPVFRSDKHQFAVFVLGKKNHSF